MNISFESILNVIYYLGALQGVILSVFLLRSKMNVTTSRLIGLLTFLWATILISFALQSKGLFITYPHLLKTISHLELAFLPLFYLSIKYLVSSHKFFEKKDLIHFIPLVFNILLFSEFYFNSGNEKLEISRSGEGFYYIASIISNEILSIQGIVYPILSLLLIKNYNEKLPNYQSNIDVTVIKGMKIGTILIFIAWMIGALDVHLAMFNLHFGYDLFLFVYLFLVVIIYILSYVVLRSPETFKLSVQKNEEIQYGQIYTYKRSDEPLELISNSNQEDTVSIEFFNEDKLSSNLFDYMNNEKPYLNPKLSLQELAENLNISRHQLSALINEKQKINFYEFINTYRVNEMKRLMTDPKKQHLKMVSLAYESGFNSKASFNRIFKQLTRQTPTEFKEELIMD